MTNRQFFILWLIICTSLAGCNREQSYTPKPRIYPKVEYPKKAYTNTSLEYCPFVVNTPTYAQIMKKEFYFGEEPPNPCWFNLEFPMFNATLFLSYIPIDEENTHDDLVLDAYEIANQINIKSDFMSETPIDENLGGSGGMVFLFEGAAASPMHFYLTDTTQHFLKGSLYYNSTVNVDSVAPITAFLAEDIEIFIGSLEWKR